MTTRQHRSRWTCPECGARITSVAHDKDTADQAARDTVHEHLAVFHPDADVNATAAASWLAAAGHLVELWGGPFDGERVWCPPGDLPDVLGAHRTADGAVVPIRSTTARLLPHVASYRRGSVAGARPQRQGPRYLYDGRPR